MKLYRVFVEFQMFVVADNPDERDEIINEHAEKELDNVLTTGEAVASVNECTTIDEVPSAWQNSIPWGSKDDKTVLQILTGEHHD